VIDLYYSNASVTVSAGAVFEQGLQSPLAIYCCSIFNSSRDESEFQSSMSKFDFLVCMYARAASSQFCTSCFDACEKDTALTDHHDAVSVPIGAMCASHKVPMACIDNAPL
jgi:hypothetical protein